MRYESVNEISPIRFSNPNFFLLVIDSFRSGHASEKYLFINSRLLLIVFLSVCFLTRLTKQYSISKMILHLNQFVILPVSVVITLIATAVEVLTYDNFVFLHSTLNYQQVGYISVASLIFLLISKDNNWWKNNWRITMALSPLIIFFILAIYHIWSLTNFKILIREDSLIEWLQVVFLLLAISFGFINTRLLFRKNIYISVIYLLTVMILIFLVGEEISWGQRLLGFRTPENFAAQNLQKETTLHNLSIFQKATWSFYLTISLYGMLGCLSLTFLSDRLKRNFKFLIVPWFIAPFFVFSTVYYLIANPVTPRYFAEWSEVSELMLYSGFFCFFLAIYLCLSKKYSLE